ncbi:hypothetical protein IU500_11185 [Nocardia terpenica]|uniref:Uncharacterized protein n=1 Tax=Nocardia terpenica TaxID=455432 RepID=A0A291RD68_9NOCA|nr:hypothetical protein CRH09_02565 [Nocardia terpenica]MBF6062518.1 hypothetical protein [Nocardia terpenica]MBF6104606.1 hypothetical protein [Nocardia terpenica]MBF6109539.1 hypothetical protein [Nocardia terpenica]MBF6123727.1 hypothetical protein [Nocardia terpenica]
MVLFPVVLMLFALFMERVENRLRKLLEPEEEVQQYLDRASNAEVNELAKLGVPAHAARLRRRRAGDDELDVAAAS